MAESKIERSVHLSPPQRITLPYTTPSDGFIQIQIGAANSSTYSYVTLKSDGVAFGASTPPNGVDSAFVMPVRKGAQVTQEDSYNTRYLNFYFISL